MPGCPATSGIGEPSQWGVLAAFALTWVSLAVGIINDLDDPANLMFFGVFATAGIGALVARFKAEGMARAMVMTAAAQILVGLVALVWGKGIEAIAFGAFLCTLWLASAWLFRQAAQDQHSVGAARTTS